MPWKSTKDPYLIWISEIILQQTQVSQGKKYFQRFVSLFPSVQILADATLDAVLKQWEGLGYNSRARNLHKAANIIVEVYGGIFPTDYNQILSLPGVGDYTASAISAFAFGKTVIAVDTNVERWVSRYLGIEGYKSSTSLRKDVKAYLLPIVKQEPSDICNQAFINFGALMCKSRLPICDSCPISDSCYAYSIHAVSSFPMTKPKKKKRHRHFIHYVCISEGLVLIHHRSNKDIWQGMYEFPQIEINPSESQSKQNISFVASLENADLKSTVTHRQVLTHQVIHATFHTYYLDKPFETNDQWVPMDHLVELPLSGIVRLYYANNMHIFNHQT